MTMSASRSAKVLAAIKSNPGSTILGATTIVESPDKMAGYLNLHTIGDVFQLVDTPEIKSPPTNPATVPEWLHKFMRVVKDFLGDDEFETVLRPPSNDARAQLPLPPAAPACVDQQIASAFFDNQWVRRQLTVLYIAYQVLRLLPDNIKSGKLRQDAYAEILVMGFNPEDWMGSIVLLRFAVKQANRGRNGERNDMIAIAPDFFTAAEAGAVSDKLPITKRHGVAWDKKKDREALPISKQTFEVYSGALGVEGDSVGAKWKKDDDSEVLPSAKRLHVDDAKELEGESESESELSKVDSDCFPEFEAKTETMAKTNMAENEKRKAKATATC
ncbi:hypothetical protein IWX90DRAFT_416949 [Phyllosticta citrichinensis]|uniref:Uncharacterized protein n=1 Tax=Phyllosticta citrichinensis TaxID=1130410 RepID=A0ABR1XP03_9PEZI